MKKTLLACSILPALLAGCGSDSSSNTPAPKPAIQIQAYDGAIWAISGQVSCENGESYAIQETGSDGLTSIGQLDAIEECSVTFGPSKGAIDVSNGKAMAEAIYVIPKGLMTGSTSFATASPFTTLIAKNLGEKAYSEDVALKTFLDLGLEELIGENAFTLEEVLFHLSDVVAELEDSKTLNTTSLYNKVVATTQVLSDTLAVNPEASPEDIAKATVNLTDTILIETPTYPLNESGELVVVDVKEVAESSLDELVDDDYDPVNPPTDVVIPKPKDTEELNPSEPKPTPIPELDNYEDCLEQGGHWYDNACHERSAPIEKAPIIKPISDFDNYEECMEHGGTWYDNACHSDEAPLIGFPSVKPIADFDNYEECMEHGGYWYDNACHSDEAPLIGIPSIKPITDFDNYEECMEHGGYWYNNTCNADQAELAPLPITYDSCTHVEIEGVLLETITGQDAWATTHGYMHNDEFIPHRDCDDEPASISLKEEEFRWMKFGEFDRQDDQFNRVWVDYNNQVRYEEWKEGNAFNYNSVQRYPKPNTVQVDNGTDEVIAEFWDYPIREENFYDSEAMKGKMYHENRCFYINRHPDAKDQADFVEFELTEEGYCMSKENEDKYDELYHVGGSFPALPELSAPFDTCTQAYDDGVVYELINEPNDQWTERHGYYKEGEFIYHRQCNDEPALISKSGEEEAWLQRGEMKRANDQFNYVWHNLTENIEYRNWKQGTFEKRVDVQRYPQPNSQSAKDGVILSEYWDYTMIYHPWDGESMKGKEYMVKTEDFPYGRCFYMNRHHNATDQEWLVEYPLTEDGICQDQTTEQEMDLKYHVNDDFLAPAEDFIPIPEDVVIPLPALGAECSTVTIDGKEYEIKAVQEASRFMYGYFKDGRFYAHNECGEDEALIAAGGREVVWLQHDKTVDRGDLPNRIWVDLDSGQDREWPSWMKGDSLYQEYVNRYPEHNAMTVENGEEIEFFWNIGSNYSSSSLKGKSIVKDYCFYNDRNNNGGLGEWPMTILDDNGNCFVPELPELTEEELDILFEIDKP